MLNEHVSRFEERVEILLEVAISANEGVEYERQKFIDEVNRVQKLVDSCHGSHLFLAPCCVPLLTVVRSYATHAIFCMPDSTKKNDNAKQQSNAMYSHFMTC